MLTFIFYYCFITEKKRKRKQKESPIISLEVVTALSIMKGDFNMKDLFSCTVMNIKYIPKIEAGISIL